MNQPLEKRQFGRRQSDIRGAAIVANQQPKPFTIRDLSEGGALLVFDDGTFVPERSFRILIEGTAMILLCELRHRSKSGAGVRFIRPSEGAELNRHFLTKPVEVEALTGSEVPRRVHAPAPMVRGQDLRARLDLVQTTQATAGAGEDGHSDEGSRSAMAAGLARFRNAIARPRTLPQPGTAGTMHDTDDVTGPSR